MNNDVKQQIQTSPEFSVRPLYNCEPGEVLINTPIEEMLYGSTYTLPGGEITRLHYHNTLELGYCVAGDGDCYTSAGITHFGVGDVELFFPFQPHLSKGSRAHYCVWKFVQIDCSRLLSGCGFSNQSMINDLLAGQVRISGILDPKRHAELISLVVSIVDEIHKIDECDCLLVLSRFIELLVVNARQSKELPPFERVVDQRFYRIIPALDYINRNYMKDISTDQLAELCGLSRTRTNELFRLVTGYSPKEYLNTIRVNVAEIKLINSSRSIIDIGLDMGFGDISSFYRAFKAKNGISPSEYRIHRTQTPPSSYAEWNHDEALPQSMQKPEESS
ncbi:MAG: helix-turn-helix transcriptional regulator [Clostridia bacterium]|nr:helix-turn-helix transcriptional regulator [Clostridia bacterium]